MSGRSAPRSAITWLTGICLIGCASAKPPVQPAHGNAPPAQAPSKQAQPSISVCDAQASLKRGEPRLSIELVPEFTPEALKVSITACGELSKLSAWSLTRGGAEGVKGLVQLTADGSKRPITARQEGAGLRLELAPEPLSGGGAPAGTGAVRFEYRILPDTDTGTPSVSVDPIRVRADAERLLFLPDAYSDQPIWTTVSIKPDALGAPQGAASSLGAGRKRSLQISVRGLRRTSYIAGPLGSARFTGPEGEDETAWLGYTAFDPRPVAAQVATFRSAAREYFGDSALTPLTLLLVSDKRSAGSFEVARRSASILVHVGIGQSWDGPLGLAVSHQVVREWLGGKLWVGARDRPAASVWFNDGFSRYLAREIGFRMGQLEPTEYAAELDALTQLALTSPRRDLGSAALEPLILQNDADAVALSVARGALWATQLGAELAARKSSMHAFLKELYQTAQKQPDGALSVEHFTAAASAALGPKAQASFDLSIIRGEPVKLPANALGACFRMVPKTYAAFELGFERSEAHLVTRLTPGGPAERAGLKLGDRVQELRYTRGRGDIRAEVSFERAGVQRKLSYLPQTPVKGSGWVHNREVPRDKC